MTQDQFEQPAQKPRSGGGRLVAAGVVGACALGVGLGLWARPASDERPDARKPQPVAITPAKPSQRLQIVVDDSPAPIGRLMEVLPADIREEPQAEPAPAAPEPPPMMAPRRPPSGLMKVAAPVAAEPLDVAILPAVRTEPKPQPAVEKFARPEPKPKARVAEAKPKPKARPEKVLAKADKPPAKSKAQKASRTELAKADKAAKAKAEKARLAKAEKPKSKAKPVETAKAEKAKPTRLAKAVRAVKAAPKKLKDAAKAKPREVELAGAKAAKQKAVKTARAEKAAKLKLAKASAPKTQPRKPVVKPKPLGEGPMRMARANPCVSADPGEALACADPRLNVRERQLKRAYQQAEASGVPASTLQRQQERWRAARAAAAREAPWAVEHVYEARIAELNDMSRSSPY